jgi:hypothetical protein
MDKEWGCDMNIILGLTWSNAGFYITVILLSLALLAIVEYQKGKP